MAAKNQHVQDSTVVERRLRPIYEWLDSGNPKKALQEAEKVLKKTPSLQCAKALKALSLLQLGRESDCLNILNALVSESPSDNSTLQAMTICYRDLGQLERVCELYERAVALEPTNEELHTHLFMSYVRTANFKLQQQSAMALYKMKPKNPYYFWAVMSVVLQATRGHGAADHHHRALLLSLAERMVDKLIADNRLEAEQELHLYLMILELQNKYEQALLTLDGPLGSRLSSSAVEQQRIPYLVKLRRWAELCQVCSELLLSSVDRWDTWNHYLTAVFALYAARSNGTADAKDGLDEPDDTPERAHEFICSAIEQCSGGSPTSVSYRLRGPYLARFELCRRVQALGEDVSALLGDPAELFVEYFRLFGHKPCCVPDLRPYLRVLEAGKRAQLASRLLKDVGIGCTTLPQSEAQMQRHMCALQLSRLCGGHAHLGAEYVRALAAALALHYQNGAHSFGAERLPTDQGPADPYALLAAHALYDLALAGGGSAPLVAALALLEAVLARSPSNFHARLLCVRLYHALGAADGAERMYVALDAKHLQLDSLGFVHCARMHGSGHLAATAALYDATLKFFSTNYRDSIDHLTFSYKFGSFLKLEEFMEFRERLNNSLHYTLTAIDRMLLELVLCPSLKGLAIIDAWPKNNNIDWDSLRDNNDYGVYLSWDPERVDYDKVDDCPAVKQLFEEDRDVARVRAGILCCVSAALDVPRAADDAEREQRAKALADARRDWLATYEAVRMRADARRAHSSHNDKHADLAPRLSLPPPSRLQRHLALPYKDVLERLLKLVCGFATAGRLDADISSADCIRELDTCYTDLVKRLGAAVHDQNTADDALWRRRATTDLAVNTLEMVCVGCVVCGVCAELLKSTHKKGKKRSPTESESKEWLTELVACVRRACVDADRHLEQWQCPGEPRDLADRLASLAIAPADGADHCIVMKSVRASHATAIKDMRAALALKLKLLAAIC